MRMRETREGALGGTREGARARAPRRTAFAASAAAVLTAPALVAVPAAPAAAAPGAPEPDCRTSQAIQQTMRGGGVWRMCWHTSGTAGLVLEDVSFQPKGEPKPVSVLKSAKLAQIHVAYDDAAAEYEDVTEMSLGDFPEPLRGKDCPGGTLKKIPRVNDEAEGPERKLVNGLCVTTAERGFAFHGNSGDVGEKADRKDAEQGQDLVVYTVNSAGYYHYVNQWNFSDDGTITPKAGATGNLSPDDFDASDGKGWPLGEGGAKNRAVSHHHNIFWRLNFAPDGAPGRVEQYDTAHTGKKHGIPTYKTSRTPVTRETGGDTSPTAARWWRVVSRKGKNADGHARSWELVHHNPRKYAGRAFTKHDVYFTEYKKNEQYASGNDAFGRGRPAHLGKFVNGERLRHPVAWVNVGFHHIARDEDQTPMPVHWQGFSIAPRDVTAMSPLTPDRLLKPRYDGKPRFPGEG